MTDCDVLVVGLGPVGALLAGLLRKQGVSVIAIDREADVYALPRAGSFDDEAMRIFQMLDLSDTLLPLCRVMDGYEFLSKSRQLLLRFDIADEPGPNGWPSTFILHQPDIERALRKRLKELGVDMRLSTALTGLAMEADRVAARVATPDGPATITSQYVVGCDGANSAVRQTMGAEPFDYGFSESWLVIDAVVDDGTGLPEIATQICDPAQPTTFMHMTGNRYRWEFMLTPADDAATFTSDETLARLLAPWNSGGRIKVERRALYRFRGLVAARWRDRRSFVAGDAAHLMPPFLGQGMCSGFRDAGNLAWKLASVINAQAPERLLDTYQQEREPHVRSIIERAIELGQMICILDPEVAAERDEQMLSMREAGMSPPMLPLPALQDGCLMGGPESGALFIQPVVNGIRLDDKLGTGACLITLIPASQAAADVKQFCIADTREEPLVPPLAGWLEERAAQAVLLRPDRHVFGIGHPDDLLAAWRSQMAPVRTPVAATP